MKGWVAGMVEGQARAADVDRQRVADRLRMAHDEGRIDLLEYDERLGAAYAARTYAELEPLTADLPEPATAGVPSDPARRLPEPATAGVPADPARRTSGSGWSGLAALPGMSIPVALPGAMATRGGCGRGWAVSRRVEGAAWVSVSLLNLLIWAVVSLGVGGGVYPWWVWVAGPWGVALLVQYVAARALGAHRTS